MIAVCAWCERAGQPAVLGEREPLDDPRVTHGMCETHDAEYRAAADRLHAERRAAKAAAA